MVSAVWSLLATGTGGGKGSPGAQASRVFNVSVCDGEKEKGYAVGCLRPKLRSNFGSPWGRRWFPCPGFAASSELPRLGSRLFAGVLRGGLSAVLVSELGVLLALIAPCCTLPRASRLGSSAIQGGKASVRLMYKPTRSVKIT